MPDTLSLDVFRQSPLAAELDEAQCQQLLETLSIRVLKDGEVLLEEGKVDHGLHGIYQGALAVCRDTGGGDYAIIHVLKQGDLAGELGFLDGQAHSATLRAVGQAKIFTLEREAFEALLHRNPDLVYKVMRAIVREIHGIVRRMNAQYVELNNYISQQHGRY